MKIVINVSEERAVEYVEVANQLADGYTSGHHDAETYWDTEESTTLHPRG